MLLQKVNADVSLKNALAAEVADYRSVGPVMATSAASAATVTFTQTNVVYVAVPTIEGAYLAVATSGFQGLPAVWEPSP